jgi:hypothetical protein
MMAAPLADRPFYLKVLASIAMRLHKQATIDAMLSAATPEAVLEAFLRPL